MGFLASDHVTVKYGRGWIPVVQL